MSRAPSVSQLLKRAGLGKRPRSGRKSGSSVGTTARGNTSVNPARALGHKAIISEEGRRDSRVESEDDDGVDEKIAALERELQDANDSDDGSSISHDGSIDDGKGMKAKSNSVSDGVTKLVSSLDAEKIEPLPVHLLPHPGCGVPKSKSQMKRQKVAQAGPGPSSGLHDAVKELLASYEARSSEHVPFYCRVCKFQGESFEALEKHRQEPLHLEATRRERKMSKCLLCRKQFTSPPQLQEHLAGKAHLVKVQDTMIRQGKWVPGRAGVTTDEGRSRTDRGVRGGRRGQAGGSRGGGRGYARSDAGTGGRGRTNEKQ